VWSCPPSRYGWGHQRLDTVRIYSQPDGRCTRACRRCVELESWKVSVPDTISIYLDLNHWYSLAEAKTGRSSRASAVAVLEQLRRRVADGHVVAPLSATHYMEVAENGRDKHRFEVAGVMAELSEFRTLASARTILEEELDTELNARFGRPTSIRHSPKIGWGAGFAFGRPARFRLFGKRAALAALGGQRIAVLEAAANAYSEHMLISGPPFARRPHIPGYDPLAARRTADAELARIQHVVAELREDRGLYRRLDDVLMAQEYVIEIFDLWKQAALRAGIEKWPMDRNYLTDFLLALPSRRVSIAIKRQYLRDLDHKWTISDLRDIVALSFAVPYCDVVVTDRAACAAVTDAGLDRLFGTAVFKSLDELSVHLAK
jgi:hypothetical protein